MTCSTIDNPERCEIGATAITFRAENVGADYSKNVTSKDTVRYWCGMHRNGWVNTYRYVAHEEKSGRSADHQE
jgi:hypothetical protein